MKTARLLLCIDALAALVNGVVMLWLRDAIAAFEQLALQTVVIIGCVNLTYAAYSGTLAFRYLTGRRVPLRAVTVLIVGNAAWAVACMVLGVTLESPLARLHLVFEGLGVGTLAAIEARYLRPAFVQ